MPAGMIGLAVMLPLDIFRTPFYGRASPEQFDAYEIYMLTVMLLLQYPPGRPGTQLSSRVPAILPADEYKVSVFCADEAHFQQSSLLRQCRTGLPWNHQDERYRTPCFDNVQKFIRSVMETKI